MVEQLEQVRALLEQLERKAEAERKVSNDPIGALSQVIESQNEAMLSMVKLAFEFAERNSNRTLAYYSQDAAKLDGKFRRGSPSISAATQSPTSHQPPEAEGDGGHGGSSRRQVLADEELLGSLDGVITDHNGRVINAGIEGGFQPPLSFGDNEN